MGRGNRVMAGVLAGGLAAMTPMGTPTAKSAKNAAVPGGTRPASTASKVSTSLMAFILNTEIDGRERCLS